MKAIEILILTSILMATPSSTRGQAQSQGAQATQTAPAQHISFGREIKRTVGLLTVTFKQDGVLMESRGTCFFVFYPDERVGKNRGFAYLVTNRHVAVPGTEDGHPYTALSTTIRLNLKNSSGSAEEPVPLGEHLQWHFPADDSVDLAVLPVAPQAEKVDAEPFPVSLFVSPADIDNYNISEGDPVIFTGFFYQFPGFTKFEPIVREDVIAMMPDESMETTMHKAGKLYLADVHVFGGNSGSPLWVNVGGIRNNSLGASQYKLLGIISGFYHEDSDLTLTIATTYHGTLEQNSGIAMVVPVEFLKALLDSPELQSLRDIIVANPSLPSRP
jgi:hypothetical protein